MIDLGPLAARYCDLVPLGGSAPVRYRAAHASLGHPVLIKAMPRLSPGASAQGALFLRGARAAARLDHPNIVRVYDLVSTPGADILVQEFVDGPTLEDLLQQHPNGMPAEQAFVIAGGLAEALAASHRAGLVHRSLCPSAVSLTSGGVVKLGGFEAAALPADAGQQADPWDGESDLGNPLYTAPEQARGISPNPRFDVYSLGALLYQMLTGRPPVTGTSAAAVLFKKQRDDPPPPSRARTDLPAGTDELVRSFVSRNPAARPRDMAEVLDVLRRFASPSPARERERRDDILLEYPTPIALAYARVWREADWGLRWYGLLELVEAVVRYCAVGTILSGCDAAGGADATPLEKLPRPSFGQWVNYLRAGVERPRGRAAFVDHMRDALYAPGPESGRVSDFLQTVVRDRNDAAHGRRSRPRTDDDGPFRELLPKVHDLLIALRWLTEFPLVQVYDIDNLDDEQHPYLIRYRLCAGLVPSIDPGNEVRLGRRVSKNRLGLLHPAARTFLDLAPFVRYTRCPVCAEEDVFVYNGMPAERRVVLVSCHGPHEFEEETPDDPFVRRGITWSH